MGLVRPKYTVSSIENCAISKFRTTSAGRPQQQPFKYLNVNPYHPQFKRKLHDLQRKSLIYKTLN